jgi:hypothetical protein
LEPYIYRAWLWLISAFKGNKWRDKDLYPSVSTNF